MRAPMRRAAPVTSATGRDSDMRDSGGMPVILRVDPAKANMNEHAPSPDADARAHSDRLQALIRAQIGGAGGAIPFSRFMELALYAPGLGYYSAGACKFGADGDFVTAPELG